MHEIVRFCEKGEPYYFAKTSLRGPENQLSQPMLCPVCNLISTLLHCNTMIKLFLISSCSAICDHCEWNIVLFCIPCRFFCNRYLRISTAYNAGQQVEWAYAFDVHLNAFFPLLLILHVIQLFCMQSKYSLFLHAICCSLLGFMMLLYYIILLYDTYQVYISWNHFHLVWLTGPLYASPNYE